MTPTSKADRPQAEGRLQYHTHTGENDLAALCLTVGAPGRAAMIAEKFFSNAKRFANDHRGLVSYTGEYKGVPMSVTTSGMGGPSIGIVLPEAVRSGARVFIRVGSCGSLLPQAAVGDLIIVNAAIRFDGVTENWAPPEYPAFSDHRVVNALNAAAARLAGGHYYTGVECTTSEFYSGQGRPNLSGAMPAAMRARHEEVLRIGAACYSMESAALFVWCATEGGGLPAGTVNAVFANRCTNEWGVAGEELAAEVALEAMLTLAADPAIAKLCEREA